MLSSGFGRHRPFLHTPIRPRRLSLVSGHFHLIAALLFDFRYYHPISDVIVRLQQFLDTSVEFWILPSDFFGRCRVFDLISGDYFMTVGYFSFCENPLLKWAVLCRISNLGRNHWLRLLAYKITQEKKFQRSTAWRGVPISSLCCSRLSFVGLCSSFYSNLVKKALKDLRSQTEIYFLFFFSQILDKHLQRHQ